MSNQAVSKFQMNRNHPLWRGRGGFWKGFFQIVWVAIRFWLAQQLWGTAVRLAHFPNPTKNLGVAVSIVAILLFIWGIWGIWQSFTTLGGRRFLLLGLCLYLLFVLVNVLTVPDERPLVNRLIGQAGQTAESVGSTSISTIKTLIAAPDEFLFAYTGTRNMPALPPGFPTPDPQATPIIISSAAGEPSQRRLRPTPTETIASTSKTIETVVSPYPTEIPLQAIDAPGPSTIELVIGSYAVVVNTDDQTLIARAEPGTENDIVTRFSEGDRLLIIDGPVVNGNFTWWKVQNDTIEGWCADEWLQLSDN